MEECDKESSRWRNFLWAMLGMALLLMPLYYAAKQCEPDMSMLYPSNFMSIFADVPILSSVYQGEEVGLSNGDLIHWFSQNTEEVWRRFQTGEETDAPEGELRIWVRTDFYMDFYPKEEGVVRFRITGYERYRDYEVRQESYQALLTYLK